MNAEKHNLDRIYFGGGFIRGHAATISTLSYAIRFWSKGTKRALFLRHEGYLGGIGAWLKNIGAGVDGSQQAAGSAAAAAATAATTKPAGTDGVVPPESAVVDDVESGRITAAAASGTTDAMSPAVA